MFSLVEFIQLINIRFLLNLNVYIVYFAQCVDLWLIHFSFTVNKIYINEKSDMWL